MQTYKLWYSEFVISSNNLMTNEYKGDKDKFKIDFVVAKKAFKKLRIDEIRNYRDKKKLNELNNEQEVFFEIEEKYRTIWRKYFRDQDILDEIEKDVRRTRSETGYFQKALNKIDHSDEEQQRL